MDESVITLRMLERIIAVLIGGISIYLGYRLFFHLPYERSHQGELELPGVKIVLSRVGPGIFFALFGTLVLYYSMTTPVTFAAANGETNFVGATSNPKSANVANNITAAQPQQTSKALNTIELLNCADKLLSDTVNQELGQKLSIAIRESKHQLLLSVWNEQDWGRASDYSIAGPADNAPLQLRMNYSAIYGGCVQ